MAKLQLELLELFELGARVRSISNAHGPMGFCERKHVLFPKAALGGPSQIISTLDHPHLYAMERPVGRGRKVGLEDEFFFLTFPAS